MLVCCGKIKLKSSNTLKTNNIYFNRIFLEEELTSVCFTCLLEKVAKVGFGIK